MKTNPNATAQQDGLSRLPPAPGSARTLEVVEAENKKLREALAKSNSDWQALRDWIVAANGPVEACRFWDAAKRHKGEGIAIFRSYLDSLWADLDKAKAQNH